MTSQNGSISFPACRHHKTKSAAAGLRRLAAEPFRVFFASGMIWSIIGVSLWPLFHAGALGFYPNVVHARLMIECFGGAFVVGFLGTAGPRMATAPRLTPLELAALFALHLGGGALHLLLHPRAGDTCFLAMMTLLFLCLVLRLRKYGKDAPPPQMLLAMTGLLCAAAGSGMLLWAQAHQDGRSLRLAALLLYQGLLLPPALGIGSFIFPRILGGGFGEPAGREERNRSLARAGGAAVLIVASFMLEAWGSVIAGCAVRSAVSLAYLLVEIKWSWPRGTLPKGLLCALAFALCGLLLPPVSYPHHVALEHLLYIGGFGLLMMVVASRVLFGHGGELADFAGKSWSGRSLIGLVMAAAAARASADFLPRVQISHRIHASWLWALAALGWLLWHRRRFLKHEAE